MFSAYMPMSATYGCAQCEFLTTGPFGPCGPGGPASPVSPPGPGNPAGPGGPVGPWRKQSSRYNAYSTLSIHKQKVFTFYSSYTKL